MDSASPSIPPFSSRSGITPISVLSIILVCPFEKITSGVHTFGTSVKLSSLIGAIFPNCQPKETGENIFTYITDIMTLLIGDTLRPTSSARIETASQPQEKPQVEVTQQPESESEGPTTQEPIEKETDLPATQPYMEEDERRPATRAAEQLGGQVRPLERL